MRTRQSGTHDFCTNPQLLAETIIEKARMEYQKRPAVEFQVDFGFNTNCVTISADSTKLKDILSQLIRQAAKAVKNEGQVDLSLRILESQKNDLLQIIVSCTNGRFKLASAASYVCQCGGNMRVESYKYEGTTATIVLPITHLQKTTFIH